MDIIGIYKNSFDIQIQGFPIFTTAIEANNISVKSSVDYVHTIIPEEKNVILEMSRDLKLFNEFLKQLPPKFLVIKK
jgi:DNA replicative helicase MCM subunit Mcm2 (Cdc46/Mcm family)